jgi:hypothetical protein
MENTLSWARKEILIKAVGQAIPTFAIGCPWAHGRLPSPKPEDREF